MNPINVTIDYWIAGQDPLTEYQADFSWHPADPAAVKVTFHWSPEDSVDWIFGRQLLADGILSFINNGDGDVKIRSYSVHRTAMTLSSPEGIAMVVMDTGRIEDFLRATEAAIATDSSTETEQLSRYVDETLAAILSDPGA